MSQIAMWVIVLGGMIVTYATRLSFIASVSRLRRLAVPLERGLHYAPPAVLAALILPELLLPDGVLDLGAGNPRIVAAILATIAAYRFRSVWLTISVGMAGFWLASAL